MPHLNGDPMQQLGIGGRVLFVYYKIDPLQQATLLALVKEFQQQVQTEWPGLTSELMQRPATSPEGLRTWMEIYRHSDALSDQMLDGIARLANQMQLPAPRLSEIFIPLE